MTAIAPVALAATRLWVALYGWVVIRQEVHETVSNFVWKVLKLGLVLATALQSGLFISHVAETANGPYAAERAVGRAAYRLAALRGRQSHFLHPCEASGCATHTCCRWMARHLHQAHWCVSYTHEER